MKKSGILAIILFLQVFFNSCSKEPSELLVGEWKVTDFAISQEVSEDMKKIQQETFEDMKKSSSLIFNTNGTYKYIITEDTVLGKWGISDDAKTLTLTYPDGQQEISTIIELTDLKLVTSSLINNYKNTITFEKLAK